MLHWIAEHFQHLQIAFLLFLALLVVLALREKTQSSQFKTREFEKPAPVRNSKLKSHSKPPSAPLALPGINLTGTAHEILGLKPNATEIEILAAYKEAIKRYHPDKIQNASMDQIAFYQEATTVINRARDELLRKK